MNTTINETFATQVNTQHEAMGESPFKSSEWSNLITLTPKRKGSASENTLDAIARANGCESKIQKSGHVFDILISKEDIIKRTEVKFASEQRGSGKFTFNQVKKEGEYDSLALIFGKSTDIEIWVGGKESAIKFCGLGGLQHGSKGYKADECIVSVASSNELADLGFTKLTQSGDNIISAFKLV